MTKQDQKALKFLNYLVETAKEAQLLKIIDIFDCSTKVRLIDGTEIVISAVGIK